MRDSPTSPLQLVAEEPKRPDSVCGAAQGPAAGVGRSPPEGGLRIGRSVGHAGGERNIVILVAFVPLDS